MKYKYTGGNQSKREEEEEEKLPWGTDTLAPLSATQGLKQAVGWISWTCTPCKPSFWSRSNLTANSKTQTTVQFIITLSRPTSCPSFMPILCKSPHLVGLTEAQLVFSLKHIFQNCTQSQLEKRKYQLVSLGIFFSDSAVSPVTVVPLTTLFTTEMFSTHYCLLGLSLFPHLAVQS